MSRTRIPGSPSSARRDRSGSADAAEQRIEAETQFEGQKNPRERSPRWIRRNTTSRLASTNTAVSGCKGTSLHRGKTMSFVLNGSSLKRHSVSEAAVGQHLRLDLADERVDRLVIGARRLAQMQEKRPGGGEIRVGALVERARTRPRCCRERPPRDRRRTEGSGSPPTATSSCRTRSERWPAPGSQTDCR